MAIPVLTVAQMREWEKAAWAAGQTEAEVIRRVGQAVAQSALRLTASGDLILILAGKGNNGADARGAREHLSDRRVDLLEVKDPAAASRNLDALLALRPRLVIDGLFGIGLNRPLDASWAAFIKKINDSRRTVLAVDVPSGLNADSGAAQPVAIEAAITLTIGAPKVGMLQQSAENFVGRIEIADEAGLSPCPIKANILWAHPGDFHSFPPPRKVGSHKGTYGHAALLAGSAGFHGAAVLAARGAQRAQPGLITLFTMPEVYGPVAAQLQAVMVAPWKPSLDLAKRFSAILIGPGLAAENLPRQLREETSRLWQECPLPVVVDASALAWLPAGPLAGDYPRLITPHPGEAARLLDTNAGQVQANRLQALRDLSSKFGNAWVLLKGNQTLIGRAAGEVYVNSSGNPYLAQGGSGDLLSGYLIGLLAQPELRNDAGQAIRYAAWQHGGAADYLSAKRPNWVIEDLAEALGCPAGFQSTPLFIGEKSS